MVLLLLLVLLLVLLVLLVLMGQGMRLGLTVACSHAWWRGKQVPPVALRRRRVVRVMGVDRRVVLGRVGLVGRVLGNVDVGMGEGSWARERLGVPHDA